MKRILMLLVAVALFAGYGFVFGELLVDGWRKAYPRVQVEVVPAGGLWTRAHDTVREVVPAKQMHELPAPPPPTIEQGREILKQIKFALAESDKIVSVDGWDITQTEADIVRYTNEFRAQHGLRALKVSGALMGTSRMQAWLQISRGMNHGYTRGWGGENIASGQRGAREVVNTWINSSGHRANMLKNHTWIGVGGYSNQWAQQFR